MTTGTAIVVVAGVGVAGIGGVLLFKRLQAPPPVAPPPAVAQVVNQPASSSSAGSLVNAFQSINTTGCTAIASKSGVPGALAQAGCSTYMQYLSPIGATETIIHAAEKIPVVGSVISTAENAVSKVVSAPINAVKSLFSSIF